MSFLIPFIPLLPSLISTVSGWFSGNDAKAQNNQVRADQQALNTQQQGYFDKADSYNGTNNSLLFGNNANNAPSPYPPGSLEDKMYQVSRGPSSPAGGMSLGDIMRQYNSGMGGQMGFLEGLKGQYGGLDNGYQGLGQGLEGLSGQYGGLSELLKGLGGKYGGLSGKLEGLDGQYAGLGGRMQGLDSQYAAQGKSIGDLMAQIGAQGTYRADTQAQQDALMQSGKGLMASLNPSAYANQARLAGQDAITQMSADMAGRGIGGGGLSAQSGASTLSRLYADADVKLNQDRLQGAGIANNAYGQAGQLNISTAGTNNAAQQNFGQLMASLIGQQSNMTGARAGLMGQEGNLLGARAGLVGQQGNMLGQQAALNNQQASYLGAQAGLNGQQAGYLGARGGLLNQQQGLGQLLAGLLGQMAGVQSGIVGQQLAGTQFQQNQALNQAQIKAGQAASLNQNINPNPYGGVTAGVNSFGTAIGNYQNQQTQAPLVQAQADYYRSLIPVPGKPLAKPGVDIFGNPIIGYG